MTHRILVLVAALALVPSAFAQSDDVHVAQQKKAAAEQAAKVWPAVEGVSAIQVAQLLDRLNAPSTDAQGELIRQTGAFKAAYAKAMGADADELFDEVIDGKTPSADGQHLARLAGTYETLLTQYGQLVTASFIAKNSKDAPLAESASTRAKAYATNVDKAASELKILLALDQAKR